ncbi:hypothetical protein KJZ71_05335 [Patescibacteria group bacterium]|nr:hypothetical protein [Patescibacteria group bacterium]
MPDDKSDRTFIGMGPNSTMESRTRAPSNPMWLARTKVRQSSRLPFVSWEMRRPSEEDIANVDAITYPVREPQSFAGLHGNRGRIREMLRKAASRMLKAGIPSKLSVPDAEFTKNIGAAANDMRLPAHHGLCLPFFSWDVQAEALLDAASLRASGDFLGACQHLVAPQEPAVRFSQAGVGLVGVDPRHVAWRTFLDCQRGDVASSDFLMDLASFAWFVLQHDVPFPDVILGGTFIKEAGGERRVLLATRRDGGWSVGPFRPEDGSGPAAVIVMS